MMLVLDGWARKVGLIAICCSLIGWLIFVICFGSFNNGENFYNDISRNQKVRIRAEAFEGSGVSPELQGAFSALLGGQDVEYIEVPVIPPPGAPFPQILSEQDIEEDFPENRADSDFFTFYWFAVVYPIAALLTIAHLILHGIPVLGFIVSLTAHLLLTISLVCGAGVFWAEGNRLFSAHNNYRSEYNGEAQLEVVPEDWMSDPYWASWLVGEWVGVFLTGISVIVYYTVTPFFTNTGRLFKKSKNAHESLEMKASNPSDSKY